MHLGKGPKKKYVNFHTFADLFLHPSLNVLLQIFFSLISLQVHIMKSHVQSTIEDLSAELGRPVSLWLMDTQGLEGTHWLTLRQDMTHNNRCTHRWVKILSNPFLS